MPITVAKELWSELKRYVNTVDRAEAAETVVSVLIDNDVDPEDIKTEFKNDSDIKHALGHYLKDQPEEDDEEEYEEDDDGYDDDWEN